jgi:hypothetical protein
MRVVLSATEHVDHDDSASDDCAGVDWPSGLLDRDSRSERGIRRRRGRQLVLHGFGEELRSSEVCTRRLSEVRVPRTFRGRWRGRGIRGRNLCCRSGPRTNTSRRRTWIDGGRTHCVLGHCQRRIELSDDRVCTSYAPRKQRVGLVPDLLLTLRGISRGVRIRQIRVRKPLRPWRRPGQIRRCDDLLPLGRLAQVVRAARLQRAGRGFESLSAHKFPLTWVVGLRQPSKCQ